MLKANSRDCVSSFTTCRMSKTLFEWFLVHYEHIFVYCFCCYNFFLDVFFVKFKQISNLDLFLSVISFVLSLEEAGWLGWVKVKKIIEMSSQ